jgi:hypothetical protein
MWDQTILPACVLPVEKAIPSATMPAGTWGNTSVQSPLMMDYR